VRRLDEWCVLAALGPQDFKNIEAGGEEMLQRAAGADVEAGELPCGSDANVPSPTSCSGGRLLDLSRHRS